MATDRPLTARLDAVAAKLANSSDEPTIWYATSMFVIGGLILAVGITVGMHFLLESPPGPKHAVDVESAWILLALAIGMAALDGFGVRSLWQALRARHASLRQLRADSLPDRAKHAAQTLQEATRLVEELQAELTARTSLLEDVKRQVAETTERASDMEKLGSVDGETTRLLNKYFDEALKHRLEDLEHSARGREWLIGTAVAVAAGVIAILLSHYVLGF